MMTLHERHSTNRPFSVTAIDHAHEQNNKVVKGDGGAVGLLQNPKALLRWMVAGPELARFIEEFDNCLDRSTVITDTCLKHHEHTESAHVAFAKEVMTLVRVMEDMEIHSQKIVATFSFLTLEMSLIQQ